MYRMVKALAVATSLAVPAMNLAQTRNTPLPQQTSGDLPLAFEANRGQTDPKVRFSSQGKGYSLFLTDSEAVLCLKKDESTARAEPVRAPFQKRTQGSKTDVIRMQLIDALTDMRVSGTDPLPGKASYFIGNNPSQWRTNIPTYGKVRYENVYRGVDLVYYGNQHQLEYDFVLAPGANTRSIHLHFDGARRLRIDPEGNLVIAAMNGEISFHKPVAYQERMGGRVLVDGRFALIANHTIGFTLGKYDHGEPLVIDPLLIYSTYLSGNTYTVANAVAVDSAGQAYVTGATAASNFPISAFITGNPLDDPAKEGDSYYCFVSKFNSSGSGLIFSTLVGGTSLSGVNCKSIAIDSAGEAYVAGFGSPNDFPTTAGAFQRSVQSIQTGFVFKLSSDGSSLIYSTLLGSTHSDDNPADVQVNGLVIDTSGHAYVTGWTDALDFPTTVGGFLPNSPNQPYGTGFVTEVSPDGTGLVYSTYLGPTTINSNSGRGTVPHAIAVDSSGSAYIAGTASSPDFPTTPGAFQRSYGTPSDIAFVSKLNPSGGELVYSTLIGGSSESSALAISLDTSGNAYITGTTSDIDFPTSPGAYQQTKTEVANASFGCFISKFNSKGSALVYSTYLEGPLAPGAIAGDNECNAIAVNSTGDAFVAGYSESTQFPVTSGAEQFVSPGDIAAIVSVLNPTASQLLYSTYLGGPTATPGLEALNVAQGLALGATGGVYVAGWTWSDTFPVTPGALQIAFPNYDADPQAGWVTGLHPLNAPTITPTSLTLKSNAQPQHPGRPVTFTATVSTADSAPVQTGRVVFTPLVQSLPQSTVVYLNAAGNANWTTSSLPPGTDTVTAAFACNCNYGYSAAQVIQSITNDAAGPASFSPIAGLYAAPQDISLYSPSGPATIYFTLDGSTPTHNSAIYSGPIYVDKTETIKALISSTSFFDSPIATAKFTIRATPPTFTPAAGTYTTVQPVTITSTTSGATIHYTIDGTVPTTASALYSTPVAVNKNTTLKAIAVATGYATSLASASTYSIRAAAPTFNPPAGIYGTPQSVTITSTTSGATIHYTTDGTVPTTASALYSTPVIVSRNMTLKAIAVATEYAPSAVTSRSYTIRAAAPTFSPPAGTYMTAQDVTISSPTPDAKIYYTTDGTSPTTSSQLFSTAFVISKNTTLKAIVVATGNLQSTVTSGSYTVP